MQISEQRMRDKLERISSIPTLPTVLEKITRLLQNPQTSAEEVGKAITTDQALASKVLKLVNSAFYGFPGRISTITHAIVILGFSTVKNVVLTASILDFFRRGGGGNPDFDMEKFWIHSAACGAASQAVSRHLKMGDREQCFIGGLIHDIGKVVLCQYCPEEFNAILDVVKKKNVLFIDAEREVLPNVDHQEIGAHLARHWNLPVDLQAAIRYHHAPLSAGNHRDTAAAAHVADILVRALDHGSGGDNKIPRVSERAWDDLGFAGLALGPLLDDIEDEVEKATAMLSIE